MLSCLVLLLQEVEETKATCQLLQKDREQLIDHNAALAERVGGWLCAARVEGQHDLGVHGATWGCLCQPGADLPTTASWELPLPYRWSS